MDLQNRGRSPSQHAHGAHLSHPGSHSSSPNPPSHDSNLLPYTTGADTSLNSIGAFTNNNVFSNDFQHNSQYNHDADTSLLDYSQQLGHPQPLNLDVANHSFGGSHDVQSHSPHDNPYAQQSSQLSPHTADLNISPGHQSRDDTIGFPGFDYSHTQSLDPSLLYDPQLLTSEHLQTNTLDPHNLSLDQMATMQQPSPTPPHLLQTDAHHSSRSPSPSLRQTASPPSAIFNQPLRPRNMSESLDPSSAAYSHGSYGNDWTASAAFRNHRRAPSDALSEISSHSAQASPYLQEMDSFDQHAHISPMLNAEQDAPLFDNAAFGLNQFSLNDQQYQPNHISPGHSPRISPSLGSQQHTLPTFTPENNFGLSPDMNGQYPVSQSGYEMFPGLNQDAFPSLTVGSSPQEGQADQMSPPEINIDFAPPSRQTTFQPANQQVDLDNALSPPENFIRRKRAKSDSFAGSRSPSPGFNRGRSPSLQPTNGNMGRSTSTLSPSALPLPPSRSPSPAARSRSRSDVSIGSQRDKILDLANPERPGASAGGDPKKTQKHPATFQCTLCPKRFTRAYNLRSHLRTHTDERPFVCTVCGKAFARQHDRKRHEGLHSGEKRFVCRGALKSQQTWGCGRKFARADALGRHFRSEAGRVCIKPLLDEEAAERQKNWLEEQRQHQLQSAQGFVAPGPVTQQPQLDPILPAALLQMYPEFANLDWGAVSNQNGGMDEDYNGASSFDASSGGEWDAMSENEMSGYDYDQAQADAEQQQQQQQQQQQMHQQNNFGVNAGAWNGGDYLSDFEGR